MVLSKIMTRTYLAEPADCTTTCTTWLFVVVCAICFNSGTPRIHKIRAPFVESKHPYSLGSVGGV